MKRLLVLAAALAGCATVPSAVSGPSAGLGQTATVQGLRVRPVRVLEDSRCPINARCIWAGRIILRTEVAGAGQKATYDLVLGEPIDHAGGRLALVAAEPGRMAGEETDPARYRFTFEYTPG